MKPPTQQQAAHEVADVLAEAFGCPPESIRLQENSRSLGYDYCIDLPGHRLLVEYKTQDSAGPLAAALKNLQQAAQAHCGGGLPLIVVPFLGPLGRELCRQTGVSWLDLSGNAHIVAAGLLIRLEGRPNKYRERGRPLNLFASKSSRVARQLLVEPHRFQSQAELTRQTGLGDGYVSKIVRRLAQDYYVDTDPAGAVRARDPNLLLDAWRAAYDFSRHRILVGRVPGDSCDEIVRRTAGLLSAAKIDCAVTGLCAASHYLKSAPSHVASIYIRPSMPSRSVLAKIEFADDPQRGNLSLVVPDDDAVFQGCQQQMNIRCVSPMQTFLDLPETANVAAAALRSRFLQWKVYGT